jgi:hypothetical protein
MRQARILQRRMVGEPGEVGDLLDLEEVLAARIAR